MSAAGCASAVIANAANDGEFYEWLDFWAGDFPDETVTGKTASGGMTPRRIARS